MKARLEAIYGNFDKVDHILVEPERYCVDKKLDYLHSEVQDEKQKIMQEYNVMR